MSTDEINLGVELEIPFTPEGEDKLTAHGEPSAAYEPDMMVPGDGEITYETIAFPGNSIVHGLRGLEVRTGPGGVPMERVPGWYRDTYRKVESHYGREICPTGLYGDSTAGIHVHISPIAEKRAADLFRLSQEPWLQVFTGSTLTEDIGAVHRSSIDNYCEFKPGNHKHRCVNIRPDGRAEWRLPEPVPPIHFELLVEFIARFMRDTDDATRWARSLVMERDDRLTAFRRANAIGPSTVATAPKQSAATETLTATL